jgi:hypothetical protein
MLISMSRWPFLQIPKRLVLLLVLDLLFFALVNPASSNSLIVILGCLLLGLTLYTIFRALGRILTALVAVSDLTQRRLSIFAAALLMFLLLMQSIGQLSRRDILAALLLAAALYLYVSYISGESSRASTKDTRAERN